MQQNPSTLLWEIDFGEVKLEIERLEVILADIAVNIESVLRNQGQSFMHFFPEFKKTKFFILLQHCEHLPDRYREEIIYIIDRGDLVWFYKYLGDVCRIIESVIIKDSKNVKDFDEVEQELFDLFGRDKLSSKEITLLQNIKDRAINLNSRVLNLLWVVIKTEIRKISEMNAEDINLSQVLAENIVMEYVHHNTSIEDNVRLPARDRVFLIVSNLKSRFENVKSFDYLWNLAYQYFLTISKKFDINI